MNIEAEWEKAVEAMSAGHLSAMKSLDLNLGHGHVRARPDGIKARCGGPGICAVCARELANAGSTAEQIPDWLTFTLGSGEAATLTKGSAVTWLKTLFEFYNGEEKDWHDKTYNGERTPGGFNQGYENEWMRYRQEAAALAFAIQVISGEAP